MAWFSAVGEEWWSNGVLEGWMVLRRRAVLNGPRLIFSYEERLPPWVGGSLLNGKRFVLRRENQGVTSKTRVHRLKGRAKADKTPKTLCGPSVPGTAPSTHLTPCTRTPR